MAKHAAVPQDRGDRAPRTSGSAAADEKGRALQPVRGGVRSVGGGGEASAEGAMALDRLIHERMRLGILSALAVNSSLSFNDLKGLMRTTDGNLSVHARKLEEASYISCTKSFEGRMPKTEYAITPVGRRALERYLDHMESLIRAARDR